MNTLVESYIVVDWARKTQFSNKPYFEIINEHINSYFYLTKESKQGKKHIRDNNA